MYERPAAPRHLDLGRHDFRNFSSSKVDTVKTVQKLEISEQGGLFIFDIRADGFLWNMVRKMVGALEKMGSGQKDWAWFSELLCPESNHGAPTAPAEGLMLMDVGYQGLAWQVDEYSRRRAAAALAGTVQKRMEGAMVAREAMVVSLPLQAIYCSYFSSPGPSLSLISTRGSMIRWDLVCGWKCATFAGRGGWDCHWAGNCQGSARFQADGYWATSSSL